MRITQIDKHVHLIDLGAAGFDEFIASYVLKEENTAIVEVGPSSTVLNLLSGLKQLGVKLEKVSYVAVSHIHLDHSGAAGTLMKHLPKAKLIVHKRGAFHAANPEKLWAQSKKALGAVAELYGAPEPVPEERIIAAEEGMTFSIGKNIELEVVETLGHASHHLAYYEAQSQGVFTGDAAGIYLSKFNVVVPTTPSPFRLDLAFASLEKLLSLKPKSLFYSHFGKAYDATEKLRSYANQLSLWAKISQNGIENESSVESIARTIVESDPAFIKAVNYVTAHPILNKTVLNQSIKGVVAYVKNFGNGDNVQI